jgi:hypothetical protein
MKCTFYREGLLSFSSSFYYIFHKWHLDSSIHPLEHYIHSTSIVDAVKLPLPFCFWQSWLNLSSRGLGPWGPGLVRRYTTARFGAYSTGVVLAEEESKLLTGSVGYHLGLCAFIRRYLTLALLIADYVYHTLAAKASGELCLKFIFSFGAYARKPLLQRSD